MKKNRKLLWLLLLLPSIVMAEEQGMSIFSAIFMEAFVSIHMSVFVLMPLAELLSDNPVKSKKIFKLFFIIRLVILLVFDFFITPYICMVDFFAVFIGAFIVIPISAMVKNKRENAINSKIDSIVSESLGANVSTSKAANVVLKCTKCNSEIAVSDKFCVNCGAPIEGDNIKVQEPAVKASPIVTSTSFDPMYQLSDDACLEKFILKEMNIASLDQNTKLIASEALKRKKIMNIIFALLLFVYVCLIFFHFPIITYVIGLVLLIILFNKTRKYNIVSFIAKTVKQRPEEKISNIVMSVKEGLVEDNSKVMLLISLIIAVAAPLMIFSKPRILYEKMDGGYGVRFYAFGLSNFTSAEIPETHNGEDVISLRGNAFSNMFFLRKVTLPDTITEIRGQAFKNDILLKEVNIPSKLKTIGGGAFYNCHSIKSVEFPDTVTAMGGEIFKNASNLKSVKLSANIDEIRGNSFENCSSLESIDIPDKVARIGGHAFYGNSSLKEVNITANSELKEIGSSAFRMCTRLYNITLPYGVSINERSFKESPTNISYFGATSKSGNEYDHYRESLYASVGYSSNIYGSKYSEFTIKVTGYNVTEDGYLYTIEVSRNGVKDSFNLSQYKDYYIGEDYEVVFHSEGYSGSVYLDIFYN